MDYGTMLSEAINYAIEAIWKRWTRWILLVISSIIFPFILGYVMEIYRGPKPAPELQHWGKLFIDGLKLLVAWIIYMLPVIAVILLTTGLAIITAIEKSGAIGGLDTIPEYPALFMPIIAGFLAGMFIAIVLAILISLIATIGVIRMARTDRFAEAFNFSGILTTIRSIGWGSYILALVILFVVMLVFSIVLGIIMAIPYIGWILYLFLIPPLTIFEARYLTRVYERGEPSGELPGEQGEAAGPVVP